MIYYVGSNRLELATKLKLKPSSEGVHKPPFSFCLNRWPMGLEFLDNCRLGVSVFLFLTLSPYLIFYSFFFFLVNNVKQDSFLFKVSFSFL